MVRIVLDPDEVNQGVKLTLTDGSVVTLADAGRAVLGRASRQLARFASVYADAYQPPDVATDERLAAGEIALADVAPLHLALASRHELVKDAPGRGADDVDASALLDDERWSTTGGIVKRLRELTPSHRRNLLAWLERSSDDLERAARVHLPTEAWLRIDAGEPWVTGTPLHRALTALNNAANSTELAMDEARQIARRIQFEATGRWPGG